MIEEREGPTAELLGADTAADRTAVYVLQPTDMAFVVGSSQREGIVDPSVSEELGARVVRRRSGGGVVVVTPGGQVWLDVVVPAAHPLFGHDVATSGLWLGAALARSLQRHVRPALHVAHRSVGLRRWGTVCFAAIGAGEVLAGPSRRATASADTDGSPDDLRASKLVGVSQRRTRHGARFQVAIPLRWEPEIWLPALALGANRRSIEGRLCSNVAWLAIEHDQLAATVASAVTEVLTDGRGERDDVRDGPPNNGRDERAAIDTGG